MMPDRPPGHLRLFVAIPVPGQVRDEILRVQRSLQPLVPRAVVRWTRPDQFHLTLRFLGNVPVNAVENLKQSVQSACQGVAPLGLNAKGIGYFPNPRSPRVIWAGIHDGKGRLMDLQNRIETAVGPFSPEPGEKQFQGHVTLARLKNARPSETRGLAARVQTLADQTFGGWTAGEIEVIQSELASSGAHYTSLAVFPLAAP